MCIIIQSVTENFQIDHITTNHLRPAYTRTITFLFVKKKEKEKEKKKQIKCSKIEIRISFKSYMWSLTEADYVRVQAGDNLIIVMIV